MSLAASVSARSAVRSALIALALALPAATASAMPAHAAAMGALAPAQHGEAAPRTAEGETPATRPAASPHFPPDEDIELMLRYLVEDGASPGIVLGVLEADGTTRIVSYGDAGEGALPLDARSVFEMGSITKVFTGILLADMVERGELALSDPVRNHLPDDVTMPSRGGREITLLDLATHSSALPRMPDNMVRQGDEFYPVYGVEDLYDFLSRHRLRRDIGAEWEYSNIAVALLGHTLERAAGTSYEELLRRRILDPLGMNMSSTRVEGEVRRWMTRGHDANGSPAPYRNWPNLPAMGALRSNAADMLSFLAANLDPPDDLLGRALRAAHEERFRIDGGTAMGLNWMIREMGKGRVLTHGGGTAGFSTRIALDPDRRVGIVRLANTRAFGDDIELDLLRHGPPFAMPEVDIAPESLARYVGSYDLGSDRIMAVRLEREGWLTAQVSGNERFRLYAESDSGFFSKRAPWRIVFVTNGAGDVAELVSELDGVARRLPRQSDNVPSPGVVAQNDAADLPLALDDAARYEGVYDVRLGARTRELRVFLDEGDLYAQLQGRPEVRMLNLGDHAFRLAAAEDVRLTFTLEGGRAVAVEIRQYGGTFRGVRRPS